MSSHRYDFNLLYYLGGVKILSVLGLFKGGIELEVAVDTIDIEVADPIVFAAMLLLLPLLLLETCFRY